MKILTHFLTHKLRVTQVCWCLADRWRVSVLSFQWHIRCRLSSSTRRQLPLRQNRGDTKHKLQSWALVWTTVHFNLESSPLWLAMIHWGETKLGAWLTWAACFRKSCASLLNPYLTNSITLNWILSSLLPTQILNAILTEYIHCCGFFLGKSVRILGRLLRC